MGLLNVGLAGAAMMLVCACFTDDVQAEEVLPTVCVTKEDSEGGNLSLAVRPEDAPIFLSAGFSEFQCPADPLAHRQGLLSRCQTLEGLSARGKSVMQALYGLPVDTMCQAVRAWLAAVQ